MTILILRRAPKGGIDNSVPNGAKFSGGQFIPAALWEEQKSLAKLAIAPLVYGLSKSMQYFADIHQALETLHSFEDGARGDLSLRTIEQARQAITTAYLEAFRLGKRAAGNLAEVTAPEKTRIDETLADEFVYLEKFFADMETGGGVMPYEVRADYYGKAARELFWMGFVSADLTRLIKWEVGETEHCEDCLRMSDKGYMTAPDLLATGLLPQSGKLACLGYHCACKLELGPQPVPSSVPMEELAHYLPPN